MAPDMRRPLPFILAATVRTAFLHPLVLYHFHRIFRYFDFLTLPDDRSLHITQLVPAFLALLGFVLDYSVWPVTFSQRCTFASFLAADFPFSFSSLGWLLFQAITRRRFVAILAVFVQSGFQFQNQFCPFFWLLLAQLDQFFSPLIHFFTLSSFSLLAICPFFYLLAE